MKKSVFILLLFSVFSNSGFTQSHKYQIGVDGGASVSSLRGFEEIIENEPIIGYSYGVSFQINFSQHISLVSGVGFEQKGVQTKENILFFDKNGNFIDEHKFRFNYNYLNVPLLAKYTFGQNKLKGFVSFGGYMGFLINRQAIVVGYEKQTDEQKESSGEVESLDFGITAGVGLNYSITGKIALIPFTIIK